MRGAEARGDVQGQGVRGDMQGQGVRGVGGAEARGDMQGQGVRGGAGSAGRGGAGMTGVRGGMQYILGYMCGCDGGCEARARRVRGAKARGDVQGQGARGAGRGVA